MAACRSACSRGTSPRCAPWSKLDKVLLALTITGFALSSIFAVTVFRMSMRRHGHYDFEMLEEGRHHRRHHGHPGGATTPPTSPFMEETDCQIEEIDQDESDVECVRNERGEWCAAPSPPPSRRRRHSHEDRSEEEERRRGEHHRPGMHHPTPRPAPLAEGDSDEEPELPPMGVRQDPARQGRRRHSPCMRMRVQMQHRERMQRAMAHQNLTEATNFPRCSFISCEEDPDVNRMRMEEMRRHWESQRHQPARCLVNRENPEHVIILRHHLNKKAFVKSCGFQLTFWAFVLGMVFLVALTIRRCRSKKTETKKVNPVKLPGGAYLVTTMPTDTMSDKEKEAFGLSGPVVSDGPVPGAPKEFLVLSPPAYDPQSDMQHQPPAYDAAPEKQV